MSALSRFNQQIQVAARFLELSGEPGQVRFIGQSAHGEVSDLAVASIVAAASSVSGLVSDLTGNQASVVIDRGLVDQWCRRGFEPVDWTVPDVWDRFARDYRTSDGRVRFHTNAAHHRNAALSVLGEVGSVEAAIEKAAQWKSAALEEAIYRAGGCAVQLRTAQEWQRHEQGKAVAAEPIIQWGHGTSNDMSWVPEGSSRPLAGLKVLDLTRVIAGPVATRFLAGCGAQVLRVDPPDWSDGALEVDMTVGKACAGLDLRQADDQATFSSLVAEAHVLVHGYRADVLDRLGFGRSKLHAINPRLLSVGLNAFGWTGAWRNRRGFDSLVQRSTGLAVELGDDVVALPYQILDHSTGYLTATAVVQAVRARLFGVAVESARLSLARQAQLLLEVGVTAGSVPRLTSTETVGAVSTLGQPIEPSPWGDVRRFPPPFSIDGVQTGWTMPAQTLRSSEPAFRSCC